MTLKTINKMLYIYDSTELVAQCPLRDKKVNYLLSHYEAQLQKTIPYLNSEEVKAKVKSPHLKTLAEVRKERSHHNL